MSKPLTAAGRALLARRSLLRQSYGKSPSHEVLTLGREKESLAQHILAIEAEARADCLPLDAEGERRLAEALQRVLGTNMMIRDPRDGGEWLPGDIAEDARAIIAALRGAEGAR